MFLSLQSFQTNLLNSISLKDLSFKEFLKISHAKFKFRPLSLFKSRIKGKIELKDLNFSSGGLKIKDDVLVDLSLNLQFLKVLEIEETSLYSKTLTLRMKGELGPIFKPKNAFLKTQIFSFSYLVLTLKI